VRRMTGGDGQRVCAKVTAMLKEGKKRGELTIRNGEDGTTGSTAEKKEVVRKQIVLNFGGQKLRRHLCSIIRRAGPGKQERIGGRRFT